MSARKKTASHLLLPVFCSAAVQRKSNSRAYCDQFDVVECVREPINRNLYSAIVGKVRHESGDVTYRHYVHH